MKKKPNKSFGLNNVGLIIAICLILIIVIAMLISPSLYMCFVVGDSMPEDLQNELWINFMGGYIAAIVGGVISLFGIMATILFTNEQNKKDRALQIKPYFCIKNVSDFKDDSNKKVKSIFYSDDNYDDPNTKKYNIRLILKNIGLGVAQNVQATFLPPADEDDVWKHILGENIEKICFETFSNNDYELLFVSVSIAFDEIYESDLEDFEGIRCPNSKCTMKYPQFNIPILISYEDLLGNRYEQDYKIYGSVELCGDKDGHFNRNLELSINDIEHITELLLDA